MIAYYLRRISLCFPAFVTCLGISGCLRLKQNVFKWEWMETASDLCLKSTDFFRNVLKWSKMITNAGSLGRRKLFKNLGYLEASSTLGIWHNWTTRRAKTIKSRQNIRELKKHELNQCYKLRGHVANLHESPFDQLVSISKRRSRETKTPVIRSYTGSIETYSTYSYR